MVKFDSDDKVYLGINEYFVPQDIADFLEATDFRNAVISDDAYDIVKSEVIQSYSKEKLLQALAPFADTPVAVLDTVQNELLELSFEFDDVKASYMNISYNVSGFIVLNENGLLEINSYGISFYADIGEENINKIYKQLTS